MARLFLLFALILLTVMPTLKGQSLNSQEKQRIFTGSLDLIERNYHFKEKIPQITQSMRTLWNKGKYKPFADVNAFTNALAEDLRSISGDRHFSFFYMEPDIAVKAGQTPNVPWHLVQDKFLNNGLNEVAVLPGNVGYIRIQAFGSMDDYLPGAFALVQTADALIVDIRGNGGGMPPNAVISYLLPEDSIHLITIIWNDHTDSMFTQKKLAGPRFLDRPVYLLTDKGTFSSAEEFAYDLQQLKRVVVVGERTGGGANPGGAMPVMEFANKARLDLFIPTARVIHPVSGTNWEGTGIVPDIETASREALHEAHIRALTQLEKTEPNPDIRKRREDILRRISTEQP